MPVFLSGLHGLDYLFFHLLLGTIVFQWAIVPAGGLEAERSDRRWQHRWRALLWLTFGSSLLWMAMVAGDMADSWQAADLWRALTGTRFGHLWFLRVGALLALAAGARVFAASRTSMKVGTSVLLGLVLISSFSGHAASQEAGTWWRVVLDFVHSLTAALWTGGLFSLYAWLGSRLEIGSGSANLSQPVLRRFSHFALGSVATVFFTGLAMAWTFGVRVPKPWETTYGVFVLAKTFFFGVALALASRNRFVHMRRPDSPEHRFASVVRREVRLEIVCACFIFLVAGFLTRASLPIDSAMP